MIPPSLAILALPLIVLTLVMKLKPPVAICTALLGSYLLMPGRGGVDLPLLPPLNKHTIPGILLFAVLALRYRMNQPQATAPKDLGTAVLPGWVPRSTVGRILLVIILTGPFLTVLTNGDTIVVGDTVLPGLRPYDGIAGVSTMLVSLLPLVLARKFLASDDGQRTLLIALVVAGFAYSFLAAWEVRMSPQLNLQVYGFRGSNWIQNLRGGGFRPFVFLHHGLWLGIFLSCTILAGVTAFRAFRDGGRRTLYLLAALWIFAVLLVSKAFGALVITALLLPVALFAPKRVQLIVAAVLAGAVLVYPMLRGAGLVPVNWAVSQAAKVDPERAASLQYRLNNEDILLAKANQRPLFGWGGWNRSRVYNDGGRDISTTDGRWIITVGQDGWYGYIGNFGLMALPILALALRRRRYEVSLATSGLCLALTANMVDLIPNGTLTLVTWLLAGSLLGRLEWQRVEDAPPQAAAEPTPAGTTGRAAPRGARPASAQTAYTRFPRSRTAPSRG